MENNSITDELKRLIKFRPVTKDTEATNRLLDYVEGRLVSLGLKTKLVTINGHSSLIAGTKSLSSCKVLLQGHIDVVPAAENLFVPKIKNGKLTGRGACDMLFGTAMFIMLLEQLHESGELENMDIGLLLTSDEETGGVNGVAQLIQDMRFDVCILPDAGNADQLSIEAKGVLELALTVNGKSGHAARPWDYDNPIPKLVPMIAKIEELFPNKHRERTTCSITKVEAGEALNQAPETATLYVDIRYDKSDTPEELVASIEKKLGKQVSVSVLEKEPGFVVDANNSYIKTYIQLHNQMTGRRLRTMQAPGSSDARFFPPGTPVVMTRPLCGNMHGPHEWVSIKELEEFLEVNTEYVRQFGTIMENI